MLDTQLQDPIHLLRSDPDKNLRARKELLLSAASTTSSIEEGSARVAAVKEELAGVQARLRDALGLRESVSEEVGLGFRVSRRHCLSCV